MGVPVESFFKMSPLKITYLVTWGRLNGGLRVVLEHTNRLCERGHEVKILTLKEEIPDWYRFKAKIIKVSQFKGSIPASDIIVAGFGLAAHACSMLIREIPFYLIQGDEPQLYKDLRLRRLCETSYQLPLNLLCVSGWLRDLLSDKYLRKAHIITNGVDLDQFRPVPSILKGKNKKILMMYSDVKIKGCIDGLKGFFLTRNRFPEIELVMFGDSQPPRMDLPVTFFYRPSQDELRSIYSSCDLFISTSIEEGFSLPPLEAMACKVPVITTDSKGMREYAIDGETAIVVPPMDPERLSQAIIRLLQDDKLRRKIAHQGYKKAKEFSWDESIDRLEGLFNKAQELYSRRPIKDWYPWEKVLILSPDDTWAHYAFGLELQKRGELRRACKELERTIELSPDFAFAYKDLGILFSKMGDHKKALEYLKIAKEKFGIKKGL